jgi:hypothetical protein
LEHLFLECPVSKGAVRWLRDLWNLIDPEGRQLQLSAQVLLADDHTVWTPSRGLESLWTLLRLTMLRCVWVARCSGGTSFTRAGVIGAFVREIRGLILQDWARVQGDVGVIAHVHPAWLRGRNPHRTIQRFRAAWCRRQVLAAVVQEPGNRPTLQVRLRTSTPGGPPLPPDEDGPG